MIEIDRLHLRAILNSAGLFSVEAEIGLKSGETGIAAAASAIRRGRREKMVTANIRQQIEEYNKQIQVLKGPVRGQESWDDMLRQHIAQWGADITLSLSLAFARAVANHTHMSLMEYIRMQIGIEQINWNKTYLVPVFSGGIHERGIPQSMQQIMFTVESDDFSAATDEILQLYGKIEEHLLLNGAMDGYSASSGFLVTDMALEQQLSLLTEEIQRMPFANRVSIAFDVAAEHLKVGDAYRFYGWNLNAGQLENRLVELAGKYPIHYIEDPFEYGHRENWISLKKRLDGKCHIFADDATATQTQYIDTEIAGGTIIKMKQVGSLSDTLNMVHMIRKLGMMQCVSHRSYETEDCFMCDLGVAVNAEYMKIGGPRRGDRVGNYNQLLRLFERHNTGRAL